MRKLNLAVAVLGFLAAAALPSAAHAVSGYYTSQSCSACHGATPTTCNGCHQHGPSNLTGSITGGTTFAPGQSFNVSVSSGTRTGWWRAAVLDAGNNVVGQVSMTASGAATVAVTAPATAGTYTWKAAWYGNEFGGPSGTWVPDAGNSEHGYRTVNLPAFTVAAAPAPAPVAGLSATSLAFGNVTVGQSTTRTANVTNTGNAALAVTGIAPCSNTVPPFGISPSAAFSVAAGGSQALTVSFAPTSSGAVTGCFDIATNDPARATLRLNVTGTGAAVPTPSASLTPAAAAFGNVTVGQTSTLTATVRNTGGAALSVTGVTACDSSNAASLTLSPTAAFSVAAGATQALSVRFAPTAAGTAAACWNLATNDPANATLRLTASGTGVAVAPPPPPTTSCTTCHAIPPATGRHSLHRSENVSCGTCHGSGYSTTAVNAATHQNGTVNVASAAGFNASNRSCANSCHGSETWGGTVTPPPPPPPPTPAPVAGLSATSLAFGNVTVGQSTTRTANVTNTGNAALSVTAIAPCSNTVPPFGISPSAAFSVAAGGSQALTVSFAPTSSGAVTGCFDLTTNDAARRTLRLNVTGTGTAVAAPSASLTPAAAAFGNVTVGQTSTLTATVRNTGGAALSVTGVTACDGSNAASLTVSPTAAFTVAAGASQTLSVRFAPTAAGAAAACWNVATNDPANATLRLTASGTGVTVAPPPPPPTGTGCTTCHGIPPASGRHALHRSEGVGCRSCHGSGYSSTTVNSVTHQNGKINLSTRSGWRTSSRSCANSCHDGERWSRTGTRDDDGDDDSDDHDDDDFVLTPDEEEASGGCSSAGASTSLLGLLGVGVLGLMRRRRRS